MTHSCRHQPCVPASVRRTGCRGSPPRCRISVTGSREPPARGRRRGARWTRRADDRRGDDRRGDDLSELGCRVRADRRPARDDVRVEASGRAGADPSVRARIPERESRGSRGRVRSGSPSAQRPSSADGSRPPRWGPQRCRRCGHRLPRAFLPPWQFRSPGGLRYEVFIPRRVVFRNPFPNFRCLTRFWAVRHRKNGGLRSRVR